VGFVSNCLAVLTRSGSWDIQSCYINARGPPHWRRSPILMVASVVKGVMFGHPLLVFLIDQRSLAQSGWQPLQEFSCLERGTLLQGLAMFGPSFVRRWPAW
jgi:hypothetical protein